MYLKLAEALKWLIQFLNSPKAEVNTMEEEKNIPVNTPIIEPENPSKKETLLNLMFEAMRDFEGKPGDLNYKNNNPLNCRCSRVGYLPKYGNVKCVNRFAVFPTWELGCEYGKNLILHKAKKHPEWSLTTFIGHSTEGWAPAEDNNHPENYASYVAKRMGVNPFTFRVGELL